MMLGVLLGVWLGLVFAFILREPIYEHIKAVVSDNEDLKWYGYTPLITVLTGACLLGIGVYSHTADVKFNSANLDEASPHDYFLRLQYNNQQYFEDTRHTTNWYTCDASLLGILKTNHYYTSILVTSGRLIMILSAYLGILFQKYKFQGQTNITTFDYDNNTDNWLKHMGRLLVYLIIFSTPSVIGWGLLKMVKSVKITEYYFIEYFCPFLITFFFCFAFGDEICLKLGLYK